jgi:GTP-binding protein Era
MPTAPRPPTRAGYVTLVGRPNAGKSTLLNRLVGEHLSIVTPKAQTTWQRVTGIRTDAEAQLIFLDTPGLLEPRDLFQRTMVGAALEALGDADVVLVVVDASEPPGREDRRLREIVGTSPGPVHFALNKIDAATLPTIETWETWAAEGAAAPTHRVSAKDGQGLDALVSALAEDLPEGPFLYPADEIASGPMRFFVAELVRETIFEQYHQEVPYSVFCQVAEFREEQDPIYIHVDIFLERKSQKAILLGKGGSAIKALGSVSRKKIEHLLGRRVYLDLWVKPLESWRKSRAHLSRLGFRLPADDEAST